MVRRFIIFATQRTGSNWLMGRLDAHPRIAAYDELFLPGASSASQWGRTDLEPFDPYYRHHRKHDNRIARARWSFPYLDRLYAERPGVDAAGMKLMYDQLWRNPWIWLYLIRHQVHVVHLTRGNLLDIVVSLETVKARGQPHARQGDAVQTQTVTLDPEAVIDALRMFEFRVAVARRLLALAPIRHLDVSYEQLTAEPWRLEKVFEFLGVDLHATPLPAGSRFKKLNTAPKPDLIENYAELAGRLRPTRFARFLT